MGVPHAKGCICPRCRTRRHKRFPNGCRECFVAPKVPGSLYCTACGQVYSNARKETERRIIERRALERLTDAEQRRVRSTVFTPEYEANLLRGRVVPKRSRSGGG